MYIYVYIYIYIYIYIHIYKGIPFKRNTLRYPKNRKSLLYIDRYISIYPCYEYIYYEYVDG